MDFNKFEDDVFKNINTDNMNKIIKFLSYNGCNYIDELLSDYLDLFLIEYEEFIDKYNKLNIKYNNNFLQESSIDMNILEEFYTI